MLVTEKRSAINNNLRTIYMRSWRQARCLVASFMYVMRLFVTVGVLINS